MKRALLTGFCLFLTVACVGCNTIRGLGEDVGTVGGWVVKGVDNVQEKQGCGIVNTNLAVTAAAGGELFVIPGASGVF